MRRRFPAWLALAALSLQAFWPLLAQAEPAWSRVVAPVCRADGRAPIEQKQSAACRLHCAHCLSGADRHAAPPPAPEMPLHVALVRAPAAAPTAPHFFLSQPLYPALARAPPALS